MLTQLLDREGNATTPSQFNRQIASPSIGLVRRLNQVSVLESHSGCVNSLSFTDDGKRLVSGSDDQKIAVWDWRTGTPLLEWESGHTDNIFQAKTVGHGNLTVVSCCRDGQVRQHLLSSSGKVKSRRIGKHEGASHKLSKNPDQVQCFYTSGEDGAVRHYDIRLRNSGSQTLLNVFSTVPSRRGQVVELNTIHVNPIRTEQFTVGGDEEYAYIFDARALRQQPSGGISAIVTPLERHCPDHLAAHSRYAHASITASCFSRTGELLVTYSDEDIYLFHPWRVGRNRLQDVAADASTSRRDRSMFNLPPFIPDKRRRRRSGSLRPSSSPGEPQLQQEAARPPGTGATAAVTVRELATAQWPSRATSEAGAGSNCTAANDAMISVEGQPPAQGDGCHREQDGLAARGVAGPSGAAQNDENVHDARLPRTSELVDGAECPEGSKQADSEMEALHARAGRLVQDILSEVEEDEEFEEWTEAGPAGQGRRPAQGTAVARRRLLSALSRAVRSVGGDRADSEDSEDFQPPLASEAESDADLDPDLDDNFADAESGGASEQDGDGDDEEDDDNDDDDDEADVLARGAEGRFGADARYGFGPEDVGEEDEFVEEGARWRVRRRGSRITCTRRMLTGPDLKPAVRHCLCSHEREEPSPMWLSPGKDGVVQCFRGHRNERTVKGVNFFGPEDEYVVSGSDCGNLFVWSKRDGMLRRVAAGDSTVLNVVEPHPHEPLVLATSGIDNDVKIWQPRELSEQDAQKEPTLEQLCNTLERNSRRQPNQASFVHLQSFLLPYLINAQRERAR